MNKFQVGDKVKVISDSCPQRIWAIGGIYIIDKPDYYSNGEHCIRMESGECFRPQDLKLIRASMSKYQKLKEQIEALSDGWNKEADDILVEILDNFSNNHQWLDITIERCGNANNNRNGWIAINGCSGDKSPYFRFDSQCEKMQAFKYALLWLLDNSSIKRYDKQEKINALKKQADNLQSQIKDLEEEK
jgi:hypothetical protein